MTFGERLRAARGKVPLSHVAEMIGVREQSVSSWELDRWSPTRENFEKLRGLFPDLAPPFRFSGVGGNVSRARRNVGNWVGTRSEAPCVDGKDHAWWYSAGKALRVCDRCDAVERKEI